MGSRRGGSGDGVFSNRPIVFLQQRKRYAKIKASVVLIQAFVRGWKVMRKGRGVSSAHMGSSPTWFLLDCASCWEERVAESKSCPHPGHTSV